MTKNPVTVDASEKISSVIDLMKYNKIHRIPVVDAKDHLIGLITEGMIAADNSATSLSIYELNYLLSKTDVKTVMVKHPVSINQNALMEEAADKLLAHDIGCLPVVDDDDKVVGILTQNDIFKAFLDMLAWKKAVSRISVKVKDGVGVLEKLAHTFAQDDLSIRCINVYDFEGDYAKILIKTLTEIPEGFDKKLEAAGFEIIEQE